MDSSMGNQPRRARRIDANQQAIVKELRSIPGVSVMTDVNDILVGHKGVNYLIELKTPDKRRKDGKWKAGAIKPSQRILVRDWNGHYLICSSIEEILELFKDLQIINIMVVQFNQ